MTHGASQTLIVDTETTGLPPRGMPIQQSKTWNVCRIVQIAWRLYDINGELITKECYLIRPSEDVCFSPTSVKIHGISKEVATSQGILFTEVLDRLECILPDVDTIVAHNIAFDDPVIQSEMYRHGYYDLLTTWNKKNKYCTMLKGTRPGERWPKLAVLYERLFGTAPVGNLHSADTDVAICAQIYYHQINTK